MRIKEKLFNEFNITPINDKEKNKYKKVLNKFKDLDLKTVSNYWNMYKNNTTVSKNVEKTIAQEGENLTISTNTNFEVKSLEDLLTVCEVDTNKWEIISWQCKKWDLGIKNSQNAIETKKLYSVSAKFRPKKIETNLALQKELLLKELFSKAPNFNVINAFNNLKKEATNWKKEHKHGCLLELCLFDAHFGKLAHAEESGKDEDIKITTAKYKEAIKSLISRVNIDSVERILLPIGNDMINIDGISGLTTAGTPQTSDSRFYKIVRTVKNVLIETINELLVIAPVDVVVIPGNHDTQTMFMLGEMLDAYYHNCEEVNINNTPTFRKYYQYGNTGLQFTHGNEEPHQALGLIFATEKPELWADVKFRYCQVGHFHKSKKLNYVSVDGYQGFQVQIIPSLSGNDAWHTKKGYHSLKQAKAFLIDYNDGIIGEFTHTTNL
jgi:hypothetical protein